MAGALNTGDQGDQGDSGDAPAQRKKFMSSRIPLVPLISLVPLVACMVPMAARDNEVHLGFCQLFRKHHTSASPGDGDHRNI